MPTHTSSVSSSSAAVSRLGKLRSPPLLELARKRKVWSNPPTGLKRGKGSVVANPKGIAPVDRVQAYPNEPFTVSNKEFFCTACREEGFHNERGDSDKASTLSDLLCSKYQIPDIGFQADGDVTRHL